jgi:hypothetical protein
MLANTVASWFTDTVLIAPALIRMYHCRRWVDLVPEKWTP